MEICERSLDVFSDLLQPFHRSLPTNLHNYLEKLLIVYRGWLSCIGMQRASDGYPFDKGRIDLEWDILRTSPCSVSCSNSQSDNSANRSSMNNNIDSSAVSGVLNVVGAFKQAF
jgi:hypothetical protein